MFCIMVKSGEMLNLEELSQVLPTKPDKFAPNVAIVFDDGI